MESPENLAFYSAVSSPNGFYSQKLWGFIFPALELWAMWSGLGLGSLTPKVYFLIFIHHTWVWDHQFHHHHHLHVTPHLLTSLHVCVSLSLLLVQINVAFANPWLSDFHIVQFSDCSWCYLFWGLVVIFCVVVQGGEVHLPTPPSWPELKFWIL